MALDDVLFSEGDKQNFIEEVPLGTLFAPLDILADSGTQATSELPVGLLFAPLDELVGSMTQSEVYLYELRLDRESSFAFVL